MILDALLRLARQHPVVLVHLLTAVGALLVGLVVLARRKGDAPHRAWGWAWVLLMGSTALASAFIRDYQMPNLAGFSPIHLLSVATLVNLPLGVRAAMQGRIQVHRKTMRGLYIGGCLVAGAFTLMPGRYLGQLLWGQALGWL